MQQAPGQTEHQTGIPPYTKQYSESKHEMQRDRR